MFVVSFSSSRIKKVLSLVIAVAVVVTGVLIVLHKCNSDVSDNTLSVSNNAANMQQIFEFISGFGWEVCEQPDEIREIIIPVEFDDVYNRYNEIQLSQGYDLTEYAGKRAKNWTFTVLNYPGYENEEFIKINVLVHDNKVIGGDVCSVELNGFMHGFSKD